MKKSEKEIYILPEYGQKDRRRIFITEAVITALLLSGLLLSIRELSYSSICILTGVTVGILAAVVLQAAQWGSEDGGYKAKVVLYLICVIVAAAGTRYLSEGVFDLADRLIVLWNQRFHTEIERFAIGNGVAFGAVLLWAELGAILGGVILLQIRKQKMRFIIPAVLIATFLNFVLCDGNLYGMFLLMVGFFEMFIHYSAPKRANGVKSCLCLGFFALVFAALLLSTGGYTKIRQLEQWKKDTSDSYEKLRYGEDTLPQGNLRKASDLLDGNEYRLHLTMDQPKELYLKGFVGAEFTEQQWQEVSSEAYQGDYEGILKWLQSQEFDPLTQYARYQELTDQINKTASTELTVSVQNTGAYRKYVYLPSAVSAWSAGSTKEKKDWQVRSEQFFGSRKYQFEMPQGAQTADQIIPQSWLEQTGDAAGSQYLDAESVYHGFVEDAYLDFTEGQKQVVQEQILDRQNLDEQTFSELTTQIRQALRMKIRYTESLQAVPFDQDFLSWLFEDYQKGNAVYFASAAVLAYRVAGYPARYVEGYHLSDQEASQMEASGQTEIDLTSQNAHAWVEVYVSGIGWMPVEVVPGMYVESYSNQLVSGKPTYQISSMPDDNGMSVKEDASQGVGGEQGAKDGHDVKISWTDRVKTAANILLVILYGCFFLYLILELQRYLRLRRKATEKEQILASDQPAEAYYMKEIRRLFVIAGIRESMIQPEEGEKPEIEQTFPGVYEKEYERASHLLQRAVFGRKKLEVYEQHTLDCFIQRISTALYKKQSLIRKIILRYVYIVQK